MNKHDNSKLPATGTLTKDNSEAVANIEVVANCDQFAPMPIENRILTIRGHQVMVD